MTKRNLKWCCIALGVIIACAYISAFHLQLVLVRGDSMKPAYMNFSLVMLNRHDKLPNRGDVIVFRCDGVKGALIKRVAGIPGDCLTVQEDCLLVNGKPASGYGHLGYAGTIDDGVTLAQDEYFVLGDNLAQSHDSRYPEVGIVHGAQILGKVLPLRTLQTD